MMKDVDFILEDYQVNVKWLFIFCDHNQNVHWIICFGFILMMNKEITWIYFSKIHGWSKNKPKLWRMFIFVDPMNDGWFFWHFYQLQKMLKWNKVTKSLMTILELLWIWHGKTFSNVRILNMCICSRKKIKSFHTIFLSLSLILFVAY